MPNAITKTKMSRPDVFFADIREFPLIEKNRCTGGNRLLFGRSTEFQHSISPNTPLHMGAAQWILLKILFEEAPSF